MNIRPALAVILCGALTCGVQAMPIHYSQIVEAQVGQQISRSTGSTSNTNRREAETTTITVESADQPEFVRLADGRLIPYGPGVICSDVCVESDVIENPPGMSRRWLIAIPIAGAAIAAILLTTGDTSIPRPTAVGDVSKEPTPTPTPGTTPTPEPTPTPNPTPTPLPTPPSEQPHPVPEPGTIGLLGLGLALLSRKRVRDVFKRNQK